MAVTIHDVARAAKVSASTVSRAYTVPELLRAETRDRVLAAGRKLGYEPNRAARGLVTGRTGNIGVIVPDLGNPFFPAVLKGAQARARELGQAVFLADAEEDPALEEELVRAMAKQVDGIVICSPRTTPAVLAGLANDTPLVLMNRLVSGVPAILMDMADGARQAADHLVALGHRRIAYLDGPPISWSNRARRRGLKARCAALGAEYVELGPFAPTFEGGQSAADVTVASGATAVVAYNDLVALGVLSRLADRSIPMPGELSVVGFDDIPMAQMCAPALTSVALPTERTGRLAVDALAGRLAEWATEQGGSARQTLPTALIVRASTAPPHTDH